MTDYNDLKKHLDSLTTLDEYRQVKSYVDDRIKTIMRKESSERIIREQEKHLADLKAKYANGQDLHSASDKMSWHKPDTKDYLDSTTIKGDQIVSILDDVINKK
jgi:hypothetical protein